MSRTLRITRRFNGEEFVLLPPTESARLARIPLASDLFFCGAGHFPRASTLFRSRVRGYRDALLIYCVEGAGWYEVQGRKEWLPAGNFLFLPCNMPHSYGPHEKEPWTIHWAAFNGPHAAEYARHLPANTFAARVPASTGAQVLQIFDSLYALLGEGLSTPYLVCASKILEHMLGLLFFRNEALCAPIGGREDALSGVIQHMRQHLDANLTLAELAGMTHLSVTHFSRLFRQRTGFSPLDYFIRLKVQRACQYLATTHHPVKTVAGFLGYNDCAYFSRIFRRVMGCSPAQYRAA